MKTLSFFLIACLLESTSIAQAQPGTIDRTFGTNGKVTYAGFSYIYGNAVEIQKNGEIVVLGYSHSYEVYLQLTRWNTQGQLIGSTSSYVNGSDIGNDIVIQNDEKIIAVGATYNYNNETEDFMVIRYNRDGTHDNSFGVNGIVTTDLLNTDDDANSVVIQDDGKILVAGRRDSVGISYGFVVVRYNDNGTIDSSFGNNGLITMGVQKVSQYYKACIGLQTDEKIIVGYTKKNNSKSNIHVQRFNKDGSPDSLFGKSGKAIIDICQFDVAKDLKIQKDDKIVIVGYSDYGTDSSRNISLSRLKADGSLDDDFGKKGLMITDISNFEDRANAIALQPDGKIVIAGYAGSSSSIWNNDFITVRYLNDGTIDKTYSHNGRTKTNILSDNFYGPSNDYAKALAIQPDGKIIVVGDNSDYDGYNMMSMVRYNGDIFPLLQSIAVDDAGNENVTAVESGNNKMLLYPNPAQERINISFISDRNLNARLEIFNLEGKVCKTSKLELVKGRNMQSISIEALADGIYFVKIVTPKPNNFSIARFVKK